MGLIRWLVEKNREEKEKEDREQALKDARTPAKPREVRSVDSVRQPGARPASSARPPAARTEEERAMDRLGDEKARELAQALSRYMREDRDR